MSAPLGPVMKARMIEGEVIEKALDKVPTTLPASLMPLATLLIVPGNVPRSKNPIPLGPVMKAW